MFMKKFTSRKFIVFAIATTLFTIGIFTKKDTINNEQWFILTLLYIGIQGTIDKLSEEESYKTRFTSRKFIAFVVTTILFVIGIFTSKASITGEQWFIISSLYIGINGMPNLSEVKTKLFIKKEETKNSEKTNAK